MEQIRLGNEVISYKLIRGGTYGIRMTCHPEQRPLFTVRAARYLTKSQIEEFLREKEPWIRKQLAVPRDQAFRLFGQEYPAYAVSASRNWVSVTPEAVLLYQKDPRDRAVSERLVKKLWLEKLSGYIELSRPRYEAVTGIRQVEFAYRQMTSRFGSCMPSKRRITLNLQLARLPEELIDGIVFHEYAHFRQLNHSDKFYAVLEGYCPDWLRLRSELRGYSFAPLADCVKIRP